MLTITTMLALTMAGAAPAAPPVDHRSIDSTQVVVQNDENVPVTVYLESGDQEVKLGTVNPFDTAKLTIPRWLVTSESDVDILVHPKRGFDQETGILEVHRGDTIGVIVPKRGNGEPRMIDIPQ